MSKPGASRRRASLEDSLILAGIRDEDVRAAIISAAKHFNRKILKSSRGAQIFLLEHYAHFVLHPENGDPIDQVTAQEKRLGLGQVSRARMQNRITEAAKAIRPEELSEWARPVIAARIARGKKLRRN